jgi:hypothetical protein
MDCAKCFLAKKEKLFFYEGLRPIATSIKEGLPVLRSAIVLYDYQPVLDVEKNETTNSLIHQFMTLKCSKMSFKAFKMKKQG